MTGRAKSSTLLLPALALAATAGLAGCSGDPTPTPPPPADTGVVHLPTSVPPTTDSAGHRIEPLPVPGAAVAMSQERIRGLDYSFAKPVGWSKADRDLSPKPDTLVQPDDDGVRAFIAVERPIAIGSHSLSEVVDGLRSGFEAKGLRPLAATERDVAGYHAMGIVVDQSDQVRDVYYVVAYTEQVHAIRLTYDPSHPEALGVFRAVLDSWSWG
ncbi:hypothetical protein GCM10009868_24250 [Terrabacter aerolatus]|uniref:Lipoprotein n=1 Tax=Terrabacter aerolatus TaxID=422442 RepID=A0A512D238_9MICO|nr:hypothetical protein [Terrabacter aerolatus]GEO30310.1 hypothetical protein TAE01_21200 [Terrabacter aerolatus]